MLTDQDRAILAFEAEWIDRPQAARDMAISRRFGWRAARYYQRLSQLLDQQEAIAADPQLVYRLRARREARLAQRSDRLLDRAS